MEMIKWFAAIDTHSCGEPLRIITGGLPQMEGSSQQAKAAFFKQHFDAVRRQLLAEPRGHHAMTGAIVTAPVTSEARFGLLFLHQEGCASISGHGIFAAVTAWIATGQLDASDAAEGVLIDCPAGTVKAYANCEGDEIRSVSFRSVPSFVFAEPLTAAVDGIEVSIDVAYSGEFYALVDASELGVREGEYPLHKLREWSRLIREEIRRQLDVKHPQHDWISGTYGVFFYQKDNREPNGLVFRSTAVFAGEQLDRSPGGAGACAHLALLYSRGRLSQGQQVIYEGITGTRVAGKIAEETEAYGYKAVIPQLTGSAYVLGFMNFIVDPTDPLAEGFILN
ncbi:proline racemase family protein [Paenibacillus puldeungensis]|uniref:Proline racemase family protein n=1 Tax=Paenibacillus puldeungensis TaxID=696536 RepID=A0ABW3RTU2_9BACL